MDLKQTKEDSPDDIDDAINHMEDEINMVSTPGYGKINKANKKKKNAVVNGTINGNGSMEDDHIMVNYCSEVTVVHNKVIFHSSTFTISFTLVIILL